MKLIYIIYAVIIAYFVYTYVFPPKSSNDNLENNEEHFQQTKYKADTPLATLTFYTSSSCPHCVSAKPEWNKFANHVSRLCSFSKMVELVHKEESSSHSQSANLPSGFSFQVSLAFLRQTFHLVSDLPI